MLESGISKKIIKAIKERYPSAVVRKRHVTMGTMGDPDIFGCIRGRHFEIEVKRTGNAPTELQLARLEEWRRAGAISGVAYNVEGAIALLEAYK